MNSLEQLRAKWESGTLDREELAALKQHLAAPEARAALVDDWLLDEAIYHTLRSLPSAATVAAQTEAVAARPRLAAGAVRAPRRRPFRWLVWREVRFSIRWPFGVAAAACLALAGLHFYYQRASVGRLADMRGEVAVERGGRRLPAASGQLLYPGDIVRVPADGAAGLDWADEPTRLELAAGAELHLFSPLRGKRLALQTGALEAAVAAQPRWRPMIVSTPQAEAKVVGTRFSLSATVGATRLEVLEGAVRLRKTRLAAAGDTREVTVRPGETATAAPEVKLEVQRLTGFLASEVWLVPPGTALADAPAKGTLAPQAAGAAGASNTVERLRGFVLAPASGAYTFWVASFGHKTPVELWLSPDEDPAHKRRIASFVPSDSAVPKPGPAPGGGAGGRRGSTFSLAADFQSSPSQKSAAQQLVKGRRYYLELWHEGVGADAMALGWRLPGEPLDTPPASVIDTQTLSPFFGGPEPDTRAGRK